MLLQVKYYLKLLALPLLFLGVFASLPVIWNFAGLPPTEVLASLIEGWFDAYGLPVVFLSAIIEGVLLVGSYFPGIFVIFVGVILAETIPEAALVICVVTAGLIVAHMANYALGKYGWYKLLVRFGAKGAVEQARERLVARGPIAIFGSYWLPSIGALTDTAAGIIHMPFRTFALVSLGSVVFWDVFVGTLVYTFKETALEIATPSSGSKIVFTAIAVWIAVLLALDFYQRRNKESRH